jgi:DNA-binding protein HU-beta
MNKQAIVEAIAEALGTTKASAEKAIDVMVDSIVSTLKKGDEVSIAGLGIFSVKQRAARTARNPRTGETVNVPAMQVPKFRPAKALKDAVAAGERVTVFSSGPFPCPQNGRVSVEGPHAPKPHKWYGNVEVVAGVVVKVIN